MHKTVSNLILIEKTLKEKLNNTNLPIIIAVSKTFSMNEILPLINYGNLHFGENKVQEAIEKWTNIKQKTNNIKLHMIGKLQSNKVKYVVPLFDYIHSLDNIKLAEKISIEQKKVNKKLKIFIQINIGNEDQKSGIQIANLNSFYDTCIKKLDLDIIGLMCLPPNNDDTEKYFIKMKELTSMVNLKDTSMGMSNDYLKACEYKSTFLRIGSKIFGERTK